MFDFGESRNACAFDVDRAKYEEKLFWVDCEGIRAASVVWRGGVKGEEWLEVLVARLVVRVRGDGVRGIRPPAVRDEKRP